MEFSSQPPRIMHIDINSCFATVEQQANPLLRCKPVAVAAYVKDYGCILAASREAKSFGVKTGMRVKEGRAIVPHLIVLPPDPPKYRAVNRKLLAILQSYTAHVSVESIDEIVVGFKNAPSLNNESRIMNHEKKQKTIIHDSQFIIQETASIMQGIAREIKERIRLEIGEWITVSCGIAPNRYLAKVASSLQKPDGLVAITKENIVQIFAHMQLTDFCGIKSGNAGRLRAAGITTPLAFFRASSTELKRAFRAITGYQWWLRLHGYEDGVMYQEFEKVREGDQKSFGQSYMLGTPYSPHYPRLWQILTQLVMKMGRRLRHDGFVAYGVGISLMHDGYTHWHTQEKRTSPMVTDMDFYYAMRDLLERAPQKLVKLLAVYAYALIRDTGLQPSLFAEENRKREVVRALDAIQDRFGDFIIHPARMINMEQKVLDRIAFGHV